MRPLEPKTWWNYFRRDLDALNVKTMTDAQWSLALQLVEAGKHKPWQAARMIQACR